jgi:hypothetical protein
MTMNAPARPFTFTPAVRQRVSLIIALAGASGSGKTLSALKIARGLAGGDDSKIAVIDTEAGRALHYAVAPGEQPGPDRFAFQHGDLQAPFTPQAYADAIKAADDTGRFEVIVVDSCSHEYEGEGGLHDMHDALVAEAVEKARRAADDKGWRFDDAQARDRASVGAWREPKMLHKRFVSRLLQCRAHLVLCLRADEKIRIEKVKDDRGRERTVIVQPKDMPPAERWVPICEKRFMYEMTLSLILTPQKPGIPVPIKLQAQHRAAVPLDQHLSEAAGRSLSVWASGGSDTSSARQRQAAPTPPAPSGVGAPDGTGEEILAEVERALRAAAGKGTQELREEWESLSTKHQAHFKATLDKQLKPLAAQADREVG